MADGIRDVSLYAAKSVYLLMFSGLTDLGMRRTPMQALGFYLVYSIGLLVITALVGSLVGFISALFFGDVAIAVNKAMTTVGGIAAIALCGVLSTAIARQKQLLSGINLVLVVLSWTGASRGVFIGMAPVAIRPAIRAESGATDAAA